MVEIYSIEARHHVEDNESDGIHHGHVHIYGLKARGTCQPWDRGKPTVEI